MEIKSVRQIKQIGNFINANCASSRFEKLTLIYGLNAFGKTTLCDIFQSLAEDKNEIIANRKTIPITSAQQYVELAVKINESEKTISFKNNRWESNELGKNIEVFGADFMYRNLFTGLSIERQNKENFTDFILGEEDVLRAEELTNINHELRTKKNELKRIIPSFVKDESETEINDFINLEVEDDLQFLKEMISQKKATLYDEKKMLEDITKILSLEELSEFEKSNIFNVLICIRFINKILLKNFDSIKEDSLVKINEHIKINFSNIEKAENWINEGLKIGNTKNEEDNCPFCGQDLVKVKNLIDSYQSYFNKEYSEYIDNLEFELESSLKKLRNCKIELSKYLSESLLIIREYRGLIADDSFQQNLVSFEEIKNSISKLESKIETELKLIIVKLESLFVTKKKKPHVKTSIIDYTEIQDLIKDVEQKENQIKELYNKFIITIEGFKEQYRTNEKVEYVNSLEENIAGIDRKIKRLEQGSQCIGYKTLKEEIEKLQNQKHQLDQEIEDSQSEYLNKYFSEINNLFRLLGSSDFTLDKNTDNRGNKKVYSLSVKYKKQRITNNQLPSIFSESDRRALALAIYWTKLNVTDEETLKKTILILDDPITSFDDNRISKTINLLKSIQPKVSQIILLTHYSHFIKRFLEFTKKPKIAFKLFEIRKDSITSIISDLDENEFVLDDHNKKFLFIYNYINRKHNISIKSDLRLYLENQLKRIFYKQIIDLKIDISDLNNMINGLSKKHIIEDSQKDKLHEFRLTSNPDSHIFTSNNSEDVRNSAKEMIEYLHSVHLNEM